MWSTSEAAAPSAGHAACGWGGWGRRCGRGPGDAVDGAQGAEAKAVGGDEGAAGVEADLGLADDEGVVGEAAVAEGVLCARGALGPAPGLPPAARADTRTPKLLR